MNININRFIRPVLGLALAMVMAAAAPGLSQAQEKRVLCATYPVYLFTRGVTQGAQGLKVELLIKASLGCPHDYSLSPADMERISTADILVINGLGLEDFLQSARKVAKPGLKTIVAAEGLSTLTSDDDDDDDDSHHGHHHHGDLNPHTFASPALAAHMAVQIADGLAQADPAQAELYQANARQLQGRYQVLADKFKALGQEASGAKVVTEHDVFDYLARDMGLEVAGRLQVTAGVNPSAAQLSALIKTVRELKPAAILADPDGNVKLAETLASETKLPTAVFDPVASGPEEPPLDYYEQAMTKNLQVLTEILKGKNDR